jgi:succinoglycan biosynthesis transport protein ExoP
MNSADQFLPALWRRRLSFLATFVVVLAGVAIVTYSLPKVYSTSSYLLVNTATPTTSNFEAQQVSQVDTQTAAELLQTRNTANQVAAALPYRSSGTTLQGKVDISPVAQTDLVLITTHESSPQRAQQLADTYANVFAQQSALSNQQVHVKVAEPAALITAASAPRPKLYLLIGAILALLAGTGVALLRDRLDQRVRIDPFATELFGLPILARVPDRRRARRTASGDGQLTASDVGFVEGFRLLFANLAFAGLGNRPASIAIVSASPAEGKSTVCVAIAQTAAEMAGSVLIVDGDLRRPSLEGRLGLERRARDDEPERGLSTYLGGMDWGPISTSTHSVHVPGRNFDIIPAGPLPPNPSSLLGLPALGEFMEGMRRHYDFVVYDTPPVSVGADASLIAAQTEGTILVIDARTSRRASVEWALQQLQRARVNVLGVIINRARSAGTDVASYEYVDRRGTPSARQAQPAESRREATSAKP